MLRFINSLLADFVDLVFPSTCIGCNQSMAAHEQVLCAHCRTSLPETGQHKGIYNADLLNKFAGNAPIRFVTSYVYFVKGGMVQKIIHQIKYKGKKEAAKTMAVWYGHQLKTESTLTDEADFLVGVPLHKSRLNQRGYNQADWIAEGLSEALAIPNRTDILMRTQFKTSQTRKNRMERWKNVESVFAVTNVPAVKDKHVLLVDDVLTTGATLEACAVELIKAGCRSVGIVTIAATHH